MTSRTAKLFTAAIVATGSLLMTAACSETISHSESDKPGWFGGRTHEESTTVRHPDGTITTEREKQTVK